MVKNILLYVLLFLLAVSTSVSGQVSDTVFELKTLMGEFEHMKNMGYDYAMNIQFPNGDKDSMKGTVCLDNDDEFYFNDCDAFTVLYTGHWFYKADHRNKIVTVVNMDKSYNKKLKAATEKDIFRNGAVISFLDSVVLKKARVNKVEHEGDILKMVLSFPINEIARKMDVTFNTQTHLPVSYRMVAEHPWQKTPKGIQVIATTIRCDGFRKVDDKHNYDESNFFSSSNGKIQLKKYNNYKLSDKM